MDLDLTFAQTYTINTEVWLPSCPGSTPLYYYPGASSAGGQDGILVEIAPNDGMAWLGMFAGGHRSSLSGIYGLPDGKSICVVSSGRCYFVRTGEPQQWREKTETISEARILPDHKMLILCDCESLIAYGAHGFLWKTGVISQYGLTIEAIDGNVLHGKVFPSWFAMQDKKWVDYEVDLVTGRYMSGKNKATSLNLTQNGIV